VASKTGKNRRCDALSLATLLERFDATIGLSSPRGELATDCFIICVACFIQSSYENDECWLAEIKEVEPEKPITLIFCQSDLIDVTDDPITINNLTENKSIMYRLRRSHWLQVLGRLQRKQSFQKDALIKFLIYTQFTILEIFK